MCIKKIALSFVMFLLLSFVAVNTADAEEENFTSDSIQNVSELKMLQSSFVQEENKVVKVQETFEVANAENTVETAETVQIESDKKATADDATSKKKKNSKKEEKKKYSKSDLRLMSTIIFCEAGNQSYAGKLAVGIVVMNRKESKSFANTVKTVIYQRGQFSPTWNGSLNRALARYDAGKFTSKAEKQCIKAAKEALSGKKTITYDGKNKDFSSFYFFSGYIRNARFKLGCHMFK